MTPAPLLVLFTRLPAYFLACLREFHALSGIPVHILRHDPDPLAPFQLDATEGVQIYNRSSFSDEELQKWVQHLNPQALYVSGWTDPAYKAAALAARRKGLPVITGMDNQWQGTLRQHIASRLSPWLVKRYFSHIWVPGRFQYEYARRLGFARDRILTGLYSADVSLFERKLPDHPIPRRFVFTGRMIAEKGIVELVAAATAFLEAGLLDWKFVLVGSGPLAATLPKLANVEYIPFLQPEALRKEVQKGGIFVLPSRFEPWGVVVHEFAAAGFPIVVTEAVGARDGFVRDGYNGFVVRLTPPDALTNTLLEMAHLPEQSLLEMGQRSQELARTITPQSWAAQLRQTLLSYALHP